MLVLIGRPISLRLQALRWFLFLGLLGHGVTTTLSLAALNPSPVDGVRNDSAATKTFQPSIVVVPFTFIEETLPDRASAHSSSPAGRADSQTWWRCCRAPGSPGLRAAWRRGRSRGWRGHGAANAARPAPRCQHAQQHA